MEVQLSFFLMFNNRLRPEGLCMLGFFVCAVPHSHSMRQNDNNIALR